MNPDGTGEVVPYLAAGALIMYVQSWLKRFDWYKRFVTAFPAADKYVHRMVAGVGSFIAAVGIHYTIGGDSALGWDLHVRIPNLTQLAHGAWDFVNIFIFQNLAYDATRRPVAMPHDQPADS